MSKADVIQENYFSLSGEMDSPSEPIPLHKQGGAKVSERAYGDRFANAQRQRQHQGPPPTQYDNFRAIPADGIPAPHKRSRFGLMLLLLLLIGIIFASIYWIRPQLLETKLSYLESKLSYYMGQWGSLAAEKGSLSVSGTPIVGRLTGNPQNPLQKPTTRDAILADEKMNQGAESGIAPDHTLNGLAPIEAMPTELASTASTQRNIEGTKGIEGQEPSKITDGHNEEKAILQDGPATAKKNLIKSL